MPGHIPRQSLRQVGSDTVEFLWRWQGVECQLLHVGLHKPILKGSQRKNSEYVAAKRKVWWSLILQSDRLQFPTLLSLLTLAGKESKNNRRQTKQFRRGRENRKDGLPPVEGFECNNVRKPREHTVLFLYPGHIRRHIVDNSLGECRYYRHGGLRTNQWGNQVCVCL